jgi:hypothetical protein
VEIIFGSSVQLHDSSLGLMLYLFVVYVMMLPVTQAIQHQMNNELDRVWVEMVIASFKILPLHGQRN